MREFKIRGTGNPGSPQLRVSPGSKIRITVPVTNRSAVNGTPIPVKADVDISIYEGSIFPGHGDRLGFLEKKDIEFGPGETKDIVFEWTTKSGTIDRRDIGAGVHVGGVTIVTDEWDDVYFVGRITYAFDITRPGVESV